MVYLCLRLRAGSKMCNDDMDGGAPRSIYAHTGSFVYRKRTLRDHLAIAVKYPSRQMQTRMTNLVIR